MNSQARLRMQEVGASVVNPNMPVAGVKKPNRESFADAWGQPGASSQGTPQMSQGDKHKHPGSLDVSDITGQNRKN